MSNQKRTSLGLDEKEIELTELAGTLRPAPTAEQQKAIFKAGEAYGFVDREPAAKKPRKRSPYVLQKNIKLRMGMPELLSQITVILETGSDQETIEGAILALIEKEGLEDIKVKYEKLIG